MGNAATKVFGLAAVAVSLAAFGLAGAPAAQAASTVVCGQTITASVTLTADLGPCLGDGLVVTASNVTLNLNGHTITGGGSNPKGAID
ncbi:MAG TPA: hypothetical protein VHT75_19110, partial [Acidimicrobiales bacterium]|nr:hypothetical protein [Acidimicrobiales bacterium]